MLCINKNTVKSLTRGKAIDIIVQNHKLNSYCLLGAVKGDLSHLLNITHILLNNYSQLK